MARSTAKPAPELDDRPEERESPVRHLHAEQARRHGREATPGYLGVRAADADGDSPEGAADDVADDGAPDDGSTSGTKPRRRVSSSGTARSRSNGAGGSGRGRNAGAKGGGGTRSGASSKAKGGTSRAKPKTQSAGSAGSRSNGPRRKASATPSKRSGGSVARSRQSNGSQSNGKAEGNGNGQSDSSMLSRATRAARRELSSLGSDTKSTPTEMARKEAAKAARHAGAKIAKELLAIGARGAMRGLARGLDAAADGLYARAERLPEASLLGGGSRGEPDA